MHGERPGVFRVPLAASREVVELCDIMEISVNIIQLLTFLISAVELRLATDGIM